MELSRNFQRICVAGREFLFYSRRGNTVERWIAINRSIPKLRNTVAITNHRAEWRPRLHEQVREYNSPRSLLALCLRVSRRPTEDFSSLNDVSYTRIYDVTEPICYSASIAYKRYFVLNPKYEHGSW